MNKTVVKPNVVFTGIGPICSSGIGRESMWEGLYKSKYNLALIEQKLEKKIWHKFYKYTVSGFDVSQFFLNQSILDEVRAWKEGVPDVDLDFLVSAGKLALEDSGLSFNPNSNNISFMLSHENPGLETYFERFSDISYNFFKKNGDCPKIEYYNFLTDRLMKCSYELQTFMPTFHLGKILGLHGQSFFLNSACASGAYLIDRAAQLIASRKTDVVLIVAGDVPGVYKDLWFSKLNMSSPDGVMRPFSNNSNGFVMGEGATALILENYEHAKKRGANIYGEYLGGAFSSEGWKVAFPNITSNLYYSTIKDLFEITKISPIDIDLVVPHGVATKINDSYEIKNISPIFDKGGPYFCALKPYFGHNLGGNVLLEVAAILMMLNKKQVLATPNVEEKLVDWRFLQSHQKADIDFVLKTTCAFAGNYSALLLASERYTKR
ncbi:MAG: beta-ketoacyl synthase N-terminal-like domain-containing protein [Candidatus Omnitrophota bacterium]